MPVDSEYVKVNVCTAEQILSNERGMTLIRVDGQSNVSLSASSCTNNWLIKSMLE